MPFPLTFIRRDWTLVFLGLRRWRQRTRLAQHKLNAAPPAMRIIIIAATILAVFCSANLVYQVVRKPTEANAILDALVAGDAVRVAGLGIFNVAVRPAREGRNPRTGEAIQIAASKAVRFHTGKAVKDALNPPTPKGAARKKTAPPKKSAVRK